MLSKDNLAKFREGHDNLFVTGRKSVHWQARAGGRRPCQACNKEGENLHDAYHF